MHVDEAKLLEQAIEIFEGKCRLNEVNPENYLEVSEEIVGSIVDNYALSSGNEIDTTIDLFNSLLSKLIAHADDYRQE